MYLHNDVITEERISFLRKNREEKREEHFKKLIPAMGEAAVDEVRKIYSMFDERMLIWYAGLWEPEIGGFYFSNSARDHEGFLPDLESTYQAVSFIATQCGFVFDTDNAITDVDGHWYCDDCAEDNLTRCDDCGEYYHNDDITVFLHPVHGFVMDLCPDCYEQALEDAKNEEEVEVNA